MIQIIRAEKTSDVAGIIRLIYETDDYIYPSMCDTNYELFETIMLKLLSTDCIFSYKNIITAEEKGKTIGLLLYFGEKAKLPDLAANSIIPGKEHLKDFNFSIPEFFAPLLSEIKQNQIHINNLCVDSENRKRGIATMLIDHAKKTFPDKKIILDCLEQNSAAVNFYKKSGFSIIEKFQVPAEDNKDEKINCIRFGYCRGK